MTQMKHLSVVDGAFLHMESAEMPMHVGSLNLFEPPAGYTRRGLLRGGQGARRQAHAHGGGVHPQARADAVRPRQSGLDPRRRHRPRLPRALHGPAQAGHARAARGARGAAAFDAARPQPPALGVLHHRGPGRRPDRLLRQGASQRRRRPGRRGDGDQPVRRHARAAGRQAAARGPRQHLPARRRRAARRGAAEPGAAGRRGPEAGAGAGQNGRRRGAEGARRAARGEPRGPRRAQGREGAERASSSRRRRRSTTRSPTSAPSPPSRCRCPRSRRSARAWARRSTTWCCGCAARRCAAT